MHIEIWENEGGLILTDPPEDERESDPEPDYDTDEPEGYDLI